MKKCFIIIDGYSTGANLVDCLAMSYVDTLFLHIITRSMRFEAATCGFKCPTENILYFKEYLFDDNYAQLINDLAGLDIIEVVSCYEGDGIILREQLSDHYGLHTNDLAKVEARSNKFYMGEFLKVGQVNHIPQYVLTNKQDIESAIKKISFPVIIKPLDSRKSEGFFCCQDVSSLVQAFDSIYMKINGLGKKNTKILLQKFISGREYAVNTVTYAGDTFVSDIWEYENQISADGRRLCLSCSLVDFEAKESLMDYTKECLRALGYRYGAAHTEIMHSNDKYFMIESGARFMGGMPNELIRKCLKITQLDAYVQSVATPKKINNLRRNILNYLKIVNIVSLRPGVLKEIRDFERVRSLNSFYQFIEIITPGGKVVASNSADTCVARIILLNHDNGQLEMDYAYLRAIEPSVFVIESLS